MRQRAVRCRHVNISLGESTPRSMLHVFQDGKYKESIGGEYGPTDYVYRVTCHDCGLDRDFNITHRSCPRWVSDYVKQLIEPREESRDE